MKYFCPHCFENRNTISRLSEFTGKGGTLYRCEECEDVSDGSDYDETEIVKTLKYEIKEAEKEYMAVKTEIEELIRLAKKA